MCDLKQFSFILLGTLLVSLAASGFGDDHSQGRLLVVINGTLDQEAYLIPDFVYFMPENSLALFEDTLVAANASHIGWVPTGEGSFSCYLLNRDTNIPSTEQGILLCISPEWQVDRADSGEGDLTNSYKVTQAEEQWFDTPSPVWSIDDGKGSFVQQLGSLLSSLRECLVFSDNVSEEAEKNSTSFALPEWPTSTPEPVLRLSGGGFPFDPPPFSFMPDISAKGLFDMPDWQFDYLLALAQIIQRLKQWLYNGYSVTSIKPRQLVSTNDLSAALKGITQKKVLNKSSFSQMPLDASELLAQLSGKGLPDYPQVQQPETVMLYPVFIRPQAASNSLEEVQGVEYVGEICSICQIGFEKTDDMVKTSCSHLFHMDCLKQWLTVKVNGQRINSCPMCREDQWALSGFLISKEVAINQERLANSERVGLQEVTQIVTQMQEGTQSWPGYDSWVYFRLRSAEGSSNPTIAEQAQALEPLVDFYSVQHLVSQMQAGTQTWPGYDSWVYFRLRSAQGISNPTIAEQAQALEPLVDFYSVQHLLSQMQAGTQTWPGYDSWVYFRLRSAQGSSNLTIAEQAQALESLADFYSVQHLVSQMQAGVQTWPEKDSWVYLRLRSAEGSSNPTIAEQAQALRPLVNNYANPNITRRPTFN